jgi:hypothetical protein
MINQNNQKKKRNRETKKARKICWNSLAVMYILLLRSALRDFLRILKICFKSWSAQINAQMVAATYGNVKFGSPYACTSGALPYVLMHMARASSIALWAVMRGLSLSEIRPTSVERCFGWCNATYWPAQYIYISYSNCQFWHCKNYNMMKACECEQDCFLSRAYACRISSPKNCTILHHQMKFLQILKTDY